MGMISFETKGDFKSFNSWVERTRGIFNASYLDKYGQMGIDALQAATPKDSGLAASSWVYTIERTKNGSSIVWSNTDIEGGCNVAILLQYGHATKNGGWVKGIDYINPALRPIFEKIADDAWREVTR